MFVVQAGKSLLHVVCEHGHAKFVELLLELGTIVNQTCGKVNGLSNLRKSNKHTDSCFLLQRGDAALHVAVHGRHGEVVKTVVGGILRIQHCGGKSGEAP